MLHLLLLWLGKMGVAYPAVFGYSTTRIILAVLTTLLLNIFLGPRFITKLYEWKMGQPIRQEDCPLLGQLHEKKKDTPTMGGLLMLTSMAVASFLWMDLQHAFTWILLSAMLCFGAIGAYDDWLKLKYKNPNGLSGRYKLLFQGLFVLGFCLYLFWPSEVWQASLPCAKETISMGTDNPGLTPSQYMGMLFLPFYKWPVLSLSGAGLMLACLFYFFVIVGTSNAVNLTDGLDGLASGCIMLAALPLLVIAFLSSNIEMSRYLNILYLEGAQEIAVFLAALIGSCLGFLWYNGHPAQVFMGDTGSLALGGLLGVSAVLLRREVLLLLVGGIFVAETVSVILQVLSYKYRNKQRIFLCAPLHHHFEYKGWHEVKVVVRFWIIGILLSALGLASIKFQ